MAHPLETSEMPRDPQPQGPERPESAPVEAVETRVERPEAGAEAVDREVEDAGKEFESAGAELAGFGQAELARVTADAAPDELDDPELAEARQELDEIGAQGKAAAEKHKGSLAAIGSKLKRWGRAALAGAVISGSVIPAGEAMAAPDRGPKIEHVEKGKPAPEWKNVIGATEQAVMNDEALLAERGEAGRKELMEALKSFDQEQARKDAADLAGVDVARLGKDGFKKVSVWSEREFAEEKGKTFPPMPDNMDALADNDEITFRPSRFLDAGGHVDAGKIKKGATHEFLHVITTVEQDGEAKQKRLWDGAGVPKDLNEGVTELFALRVAQKEGVKIENHQAYAGGNLVAARLLEGLVGQKDLFADYVDGKTDRIKTALDAKLGKGAAERILAHRVDVGQEGDTLAMALELSKSGVDVEKLWSEAKAEGFLDDLKVSPDGKAVTISRDIEGVAVLVNSMVDEGGPVSEEMPVMRVFASTLKEGKTYDAENVQRAADGAQHVAEIASRTRQELQAQLDGLAEEYRQAERAEDTAKLKTLDPPEAMAGILKDVLPGQINEAKADAFRRGENVADANVFFNTQKAMAELQRAYKSAATPEAKAAARSALEAANEAAARDASKKIRLENLTPPIPPRAK